MSQNRRKAKDDREHEEGPVGYCKPPVSTRFKPGVSGNKKGRPKRRQQLGELISQGLDRRVSFIENGSRKTITMREAILRNLIRKASKGDLPTIKFIFDQSPTDSPRGISHEEALLQMAAELGIEPDE